MTDPKKLVESLDATALRHRLEEIEAERIALLVLLRAAVRREHHLRTMIPQATTTKRKAVNS